MQWLRVYFDWVPGLGVCAGGNSDAKFGSIAFYMDDAAQQY